MVLVLEVFVEALVVERVEVLVLLKPRSLLKNGGRNIATVQNGGYSRLQSVTAGYAPFTAGYSQSRSVTLLRKQQAGFLSSIGQVLEFQSQNTYFTYSIPKPSAKTFQLLRALLARELAACAAGYIPKLGLHAGLQQQQHQKLAHIRASQNQVAPLFPHVL